ncbi:HNH endonuclease domain-containing protein [Mucilaginibacter sp. Mucisp84]|uniref:HNH endonuclease domain-containing protein n=1 Tax=Mucilaginibacter sp. Mucisp84 TaxID=3243058 RepID=UPI0039A66ABA
MNLPGESNLPIHLLSACFNNTSATYKFYWFLAILSRIETGESVIAKNDLFAEMIANSWFTINYFHISFGKQDKLQHAVEQIKALEHLTIDADKASIFKKLTLTTNKASLKELNYFNSEVPHRFLSPWFRADDMNLAYLQSQTYSNNCPYALYKDKIEVNPAWINYLQKNARVLKDFCYWNLAMYLQSKNPNVPDIPNKLIKSPIRKNLTEQRRKFWDIVLNELGSVDCIYTNSRLTVGNYAVEHFIPYAFVSHDLIWNLIPADRSFNSSKNDKLPNLPAYFEPFYKLQYAAKEIVQHQFPKNKFLEDYLTIFPSLENEHFNSKKYLELLQPLVTIASNNGFQFL